MNIQFPGYEGIVPNEVYRRATVDQSIIDSSCMPVPLLDILLLSRFLQPTREQIVTHLKETAAKVETAASLLLPGQSPSAENYTTLERAVMGLPPKDRLNLRDGHAELYQEIINPTIHAPDTEDQAFEYVRVISGRLPAESIMGERADFRQAYAAYRDLLENPKLKKLGLGSKGLLQLRLGEGTLPDYDFVSKLPDHIPPCNLKTVAAIGSLATPQPFNIVVEGLYPGQTSGYLASIPDRSTDELEMHALAPVAALHQYLDSQRARQENAAATKMVVDGLLLRRPGQKGLLV